MLQFTHLFSGKFQYLIFFYKYQCNWKQLTQQTNDCINYHMIERTHVPRSPCLKAYVRVENVSIFAKRGERGKQDSDLRGGKVSCFQFRQHYFDTSDKFCSFMGELVTMAWSYIQNNCKWWTEECLGNILKASKAGILLIMTRSQYKGKYLSGHIPKNLTLCRIHEIFFQKHHEKSFIQSFPMMYIKGGSTFGRSQSKQQ